MRSLCLLIDGYSAFSSILKMQAVRTFETPVNFYQTTGRHGVTLRSVPRNIASPSALRSPLVRCINSMKFIQNCVCYSFDIQFVSLCVLLVGLSIGALRFCSLMASNAGAAAIRLWQSCETEQVDVTSVKILHYSCFRKVFNPQNCNYTLIEYYTG